LVGLVIESVSKSAQKEINRDQIRWVLTIPANWSDREKYLMRNAAHAAGMISKIDESPERFLFALEPEAAGLYSCITMKKMEKVSELMMNEGENFMIIDAGGGTLDLTAHQVLKGGYLKELCTGKGAAFGSSLFFLKY
jgi:molecular chaperone DnaK (HSP70)